LHFLSELSVTLEDLYLMPKIADKGSIGKHFCAGSVEGGSLRQKYGVERSLSVSAENIPVFITTADHAWQTRKKRNGGGGEKNRDD